MSNDLNVINVSDIDDYLKKFCGSDARLEIFLISALSNIIRKSPDSMEELRSLPEDAPAWLVRKWEEHEFWHIFKDKKNMRLAGNVYDIVNWIEEAIEVDMPWVNNLDKKGRPIKLLKASTHEQLLNVKKKDEEQILVKRQKLAEKMLIEESSNKDFEKVMSFDNGYYIVLLKTERALDIEGDCLHHCIGNGNYDHWLNGDVQEFYSLRNKNHMPCLSMAVKKDTYALHEVRGKRNSYPKGKYIPYVATFCHRAGLLMSDALSFDEGFKYLRDDF